VVACVLFKKTPTFGSRRSKLDHLPVQLGFQVYYNWCVFPRCPHICNAEWIHPYILKFESKREQFRRKMCSGPGTTSHGNLNRSPVRFSGNVQATVKVGRGPTCGTLPGKGGAATAAGTTVHHSPASRSRQLSGKGSRVKLSTKGCHQEGKVGNQRTSVTPAKLTASRTRNKPNGKRGSQQADKKNPKDGGGGPSCNVSWFEAKPERSRIQPYRWRIHIAQYMYWFFLDASLDYIWRRRWPFFYTGIRCLVLSNNLKPWFAFQQSNWG
jgi:hypothetical protein